MIYQGENFQIVMAIKYELFIGDKIKKGGDPWDDWFKNSRYYGVKYSEIEVE